MCMQIEMLFTPHLLQGLVVRWLGMLHMLLPSQRVEYMLRD